MVCIDGGFPKGSQCFFDGGCRGCLISADLELVGNSHSLACSRGFVPRDSARRCVVECGGGILRGSKGEDYALTEIVRVDGVGCGGRDDGCSNRCGLCYQISFRHLEWEWAHLEFTIGDGRVLLEGGC